MRAKFLRAHWQTVKRLFKLKKKTEQDGQYRLAKRIHAVVLNMEGRRSTEISTLLQSPRSVVSMWLKKYSDQGLEGLSEGHRSGRPRGLGEEEREQLTDIVDSGPVAYGFLSGVWTSPMIARVINEEFEIEYHPGHVRKMLHGLGFSVQRPKRLLARADAAKKAGWIRETYPEIKKKPKGRKPL